MIKTGDICTYSYDNENKSLCIVEVVKELPEDGAVVAFHQVIVDDSGNSLFTYLLNSGETMNVSKKYLTKINIVESMEIEIERLKNALSLSRKEFAEKLKEKAETQTFTEHYPGGSYDFTISTVDMEDIDDTLKELEGIIIHSADDEIPNCPCCDHFNSNFDCFDKCGAECGWKSYQRTEKIKLEDDE